MDKWMPALKLTGIGFYVATCIAGGTFLGWWLGGKQPLYIIIGLVTGLIIAGYGVYHMLRLVIKETNNQEKR